MTPSESPSMSSKPPWEYLTETQRRWFALGWNLSGEGYNHEYPGLTAEDAYDDIDDAEWNRHVEA